MNVIQSLVLSGSYREILFPNHILNAQLTLVAVLKINVIPGLGRVHQNLNQA